MPNRALPPAPGPLPASPFDPLPPPAPALQPLDPHPKPAPDSPSTEAASEAVIFDNIEAVQRRPKPAVLPYSGGRAGRGFRSRSELRVALTLALPRYRGASLEERAARAKVTPTEYASLARSPATQRLVQDFRAVEIMIDRQQVYDRTVQAALSAGKNAARDRLLFFQLEADYFRRDKTVDHIHRGEVSHVHSADESLGAALRDARRRDRPKIIDAEGRELAPDQLPIDFSEPKNGESAP